MVTETASEQYMITLLQKLVRIPSRSFPSGGEEGKIQRFIAGEITRFGIPVRTVEPEDVPVFHSHRLCHGPDRKYQDRITVIAETGPEAAETLLILAHSDTVPINHPEAWRTDPFSGIIQEGKVLGLGSCDDKWGIAVMLTMLKELTEQQIYLRKRIVWATTIDEESGVCNGTLLLKLAGIEADSILYLDGADFQICIGNMGGSNLYLIPVQSLRVEETDRHAAALEDHCRLLSQERSELFNRPHFRENIVRKGSVKFRRDPEEPSRFIIHFYTLPEEERKAVENWLEDLVSEALGSDSDCYKRSYREPWFEPSIIPRRPPLLNMLKQETERERKQTPVVTTISKQDGFIFNNYFNSPCISFGAAASSGEGTFHEPNEHMDIDNLCAAYRIVRNTLMAWLNS